MAYLTHSSYKEIEKFCEEGRISRDVANEAHRQNRIIYEAREEHYAAEAKMIRAIRELNKMVVKNEERKA